MSNEPTYSKPRSFNNLLAVALLLLLGCFAETPGQWTTDANQNMSNTNTGNVGIGTASPSALLEVKKSQNAGTIIIVDNPFTTSPNTAFSGMFMKQGGANRLFVGSINDNNNIHFGGPGAVQFWNFVNGPILFSTNNAEAMRISFANSNIANGNDKRLATISAFSDGALNSGRIAFGTSLSGTHAEHADYLRR